MVSFPLLSALPVDVTVLDQVDSTNRYLSDNPGNVSRWRVILTDNQTNGRGRQGRHWVTPSGAGLAVSIGLPDSIHPTPLDGSWFQLLSLVTGSVVAEAISSEISERVTVKWPNDVLVGRKKVAGILGEIGPHMSVIVGVGINLDIPEDGLPTPQATSLSAHGASGEGLADRLVSALVGGLMERVPQIDVPVSSHQWDWLQHWMGTPGKHVRVELPGGKSFNGQALGIDKDGALIVRDSLEGQSVRVTVGDIEHLRHTDADGAASADGSK